MSGRTPTVTALENHLATLGTSSGPHSRPSPNSPTPSKPISTGPDSAAAPCSSACSGTSTPATPGSASTCHPDRPPPSCRSRGHPSKRNERKDPGRPGRLKPTPVRRGYRRAPDRRPDRSPGRSSLPATAEATRWPTDRPGRRPTSTPSRSTPAARARPTSTFNASRVLPPLPLKRRTHLARPQQRLVERPVMDLPLSELAHHARQRPPRVRVVERAAHLQHRSPRPARPAPSLTNSVRVGKCRYRVATPTPARRATSRMGASRPRRRERLPCRRHHPITVGPGIGTLHLRHLRPTTLSLDPTAERLLRFRPTVRLPPRQPGRGAPDVRRAVRPVRRSRGTPPRQHRRSHSPGPARSASASGPPASPPSTSASAPAAPR